MYLNADYITPVELTGYARRALADLTVNQFRLAQWLPNNNIDDLEYRFTRGGDGLTEAATFRAYDAESPVGSRPGVTRVTGELPPISKKIRLGEYDRLRQRRADPAIRDAILDDTIRMSRAVAARLELARGEALSTGKLILDENNVIATVDYGRTAGHTVTAGASWATTSTDILADLLSWRDTYVDTNGSDPGVILTSRTVLGYMVRNSGIAELAATLAGTPSVVSETALQATLNAYGLPPVQTYDAKVTIEGVTTRVIPADKLLFLPAPGNANDPASSELGATLLGTTAESMEPGYGIADEAEQPGIVAGAYTTQDPVAVWTKAAAIGLPVLANPDLTFAADVVP
jgi:hypothetical protein